MDSILFPLCNGLNRNGSHRFVYLDSWSLGVALLRSVALLEWVWPYWSGCGLVRVGVALLEWVWPCWSGCDLVGVGVAFVGVGVALLEWVWPCWGKCVTGVGSEVSDAQARPSVALSSCCLQIQIELSAPSPAPCLPLCHHVSCHNGLHL